MGAEKYGFTICLEGEPGYFFNSSSDYHSLYSCLPFFRLCKPLELWKIWGREQRGEFFFPLV